MKLSKLYDALAKHDWNYQYASGSAYYAGQSSWYEIERASRISPKHLQLLDDWRAARRGDRALPERPIDEDEASEQ